MGVVTGGLGFYPPSGSQSYTGVGLTNITSSGDSLTATVTVTNGAVSGATITSSGSGFQVGDVLGIDASGVGVGTTSVGRNARLSVLTITDPNEIILDNVQGNFVTGNGKLMTFTHPITGITTIMNSNGSTGGAIEAKSVQVVNDGLHFTVDHRNHGMHHETNRVQVDGVQSDVLPTKLSLPYNTSASGSIAIEASDNFTTFENVAVGATNPGLVQIGDEIMKYTSVSSGSLGGITRGTGRSNYLKGQPDYKYELSGVSLARINRTHRMNQVSDRDPNPISFDSYTLKIDNSQISGGVVDAINRSSGSSFPILYAGETKSTGGYKITASQNIPFQLISPNIQNVTVPGTTVRATMRTVSASSLGNGMGQGTDLPFMDKGYESITLNKTNYLNSPRMIASRVNETNNAVIQNFNGDRSFGITVNLDTSDTLLTPVIDLQRTSAIFVSNRVDTPITNYKEDNRVNSLYADPTACQYVSKENGLTNSATSIKILLDAYINEYSDIRAFYAISDTSNFEPIFIPFPGYINLNDQGEMISLADSDGRSDKKMPLGDTGMFKSSELSFREYSFTADNLPSFNNYRIKFLLTSNNQTWVPRVSNLRVITLA